MLLSCQAAPLSIAAILLDRERDMPHGLFGDRDTGPTPCGSAIPRGCGLFGRLGDEPKIAPANPSPMTEAARERRDPPPPHGDA